MLMWYRAIKKPMANSAHNKTLCGSIGYSLLIPFIILIPDEEERPWSADEENPPTPKVPCGFQEQLPHDISFCASGWRSLFQRQRQAGTISSSYAHTVGSTSSSWSWGMAAEFDDNWSIGKSAPWESPCRND